MDQRLKFGDPGWFGILAATLEVSRLGFRLARLLLILSFLR